MMILSNCIFKFLKFQKFQKIYNKTRCKNLDSNFVNYDYESVNKYLKEASEEIRTFDSSEI